MIIVRSVSDPNWFVLSLASGLFWSGLVWTIGNLMFFLRNRSLVRKSIPDIEDKEEKTNKFSGSIVRVSIALFLTACSLVAFTFWFMFIGLPRSCEEAVDTVPRLMVAVNDVGFVGTLVRTDTLVKLEPTTTHYLRGKSEYYLVRYRFRIIEPIMGLQSDTIVYLLTHTSSREDVYGELHIAILKPDQYITFGNRILDVDQFLDIPWWYHWTRDTSFKN